MNLKCDIFYLTFFERMTFYTFRSCRFENGFLTLVTLKMTFDACYFENDFLTRDSLFCSQMKALISLKMKAFQKAVNDAFKDNFQSF